MVMMLLKIQIAEKYLSIRFQHLTFFGGPLRAPKTHGGLFFIQKSKHHRASQSSNMVTSELLRFPLTSSRCSYSLDPCEEDEIHEVR